MVDAVFLVFAADSSAAAGLPVAAAGILVDPGASLSEDVFLLSVYFPAAVARFPVIVCG